MFRILIAMIIGGGFMVYFGFQEMTLASKTESTPQVISCQDLSEAGPGDNANVEMSEFMLCTMSFVYEAIGNSDTAYKTVWVPAVPLDGEYHQQLLSMLDDEGNLVGEPPMPKDLGVLVKTSKASNENALYNLADQETLSGLVINEIASLGSEEKKILKDSYPGVNFDKVWILEHGRQPAGAGKTYGLMGGGLLLIVIGLGLGASSMGLFGRGSDEIQQAPPAQDV